MNSVVGVHSNGGPGPLRRGLDTLRVKLFLAIAGAHLVLVAVVYLIYSWTFDSSLVEYVKRSEQDRLSPVIQQLAEGYQKHDSWMWLTDSREHWGDLLREVLGMRAGRPVPIVAGAPGTADTARDLPPEPRKGQAGGSPNERPPWNFQADPAGWPLTIDLWRVMLFDADGKVLILFPRGTQQDAEMAEKLPIRVDGKLVGYLGYIPRLAQVESLESITRKQQSQRIQVIGMGMFATVLIIAWLIALWLSRRLSVVGQGAAALARGDYSTRIPAQGHDELARLAGDFNHLAEALEAAQRGRQQWIADIAHELRTPLTALRAEIEAVVDGVRPLTQGTIASVGQEVHRLTRLVEDLRLLTLSDLGALTYRKQPLELEEAIADALAANRAAIEQKQLKVEARLDATFVIDADADRLAQVFGNLLQNTLRYTDAPARLRIGLAAEGREVRIDWEDSSPGVGDVDLPHLTERLYRVDASRSSASGGSGLGLAIAQAIVHAHGGRMQAAHSSLGGLHWRIWLPLSDHRLA
jgi:two-component system, OmpR family, sensor histidine kinase BaeS